MLLLAHPAGEASGEDVTPWQVGESRCRNRMETATRPRRRFRRRGRGSSLGKIGDEDLTLAILTGAGRGDDRIDHALIVGAQRVSTNVVPLEPKSNREAVPFLGGGGPIAEALIDGLVKRS